MLIQLRKRQSISRDQISWVLNEEDKNYLRLVNRNHIILEFELNLFTIKNMNLEGYLHFSQALLEEIFTCLCF